MSLSELNKIACKKPRSFQTRLQKDTMSSVSVNKHNKGQHFSLRPLSPLTEVILRIFRVYNSLIPAPVLAKGKLRRKLQQGLVFMRHQPTQTYSGSFQRNSTVTKKEETALLGSFLGHLYMPESPEAIHLFKWQQQTKALFPQNNRTQVESSADRSMLLLSCVTQLWLPALWRVPSPVELYLMYLLSHLAVAAVQVSSALQVITDCPFSWQPSLHLMDMF